MVDCTSLQHFYWLWYCWDAPNWLTLFAEVIVAVFLGLLFLNKGSELAKEEKKLRDSQRIIAEGFLQYAIYAILDNMDKLEGEYHHAKTNGSNEVNPQIWNEKTIPMLTENKKKLDDAIKSYGNALKGQLIASINSVSEILPSFTLECTLENSKRINEVRKRVIFLSDELEDDLIPWIHDKIKNTRHNTNF